ncbi:hypothetical protein Theco_3625 [Thermobacillus composti KWC4]|uniref:Uncharacterized protein n=1 Tax=Thermobacillus composti (strain DSM 18247 / JCM 13945 / KWC4) TaxID=717605 RepID=L0EJ49_THECK|nr:hypothetical protein [Thermobacillus composti]AGA59649.1 hypothetical protein Theco_3625 [Thermobacillus composti KWC4]
MSKIYTLSEVSRLMGASEPLILYWISLGRFPGVTLEEPVFRPDTKCVSPYGETLTIAEIEELYHQEQKRLGRDKPITLEEEIQILKDEIRYFEEKYGGPFEKTLGAKRELSSDEERDAVEWESLLRSLERRISNLNSQ